MSPPREMPYTCPRCGMISHNPNDEREGYCGNCHDWTRDDEDHAEDHPEFSVYQFLPDGSYEAVVRFVSGKTAVETAKRCTETVSGRIGTTVRVIITDGGDYTCFEWQYGKGVTYPSPDVCGL
jgi:hypothetical protein